MLFLQQQHGQPGTAPARCVCPQTVPTPWQVTQQQGHCSHLPAWPNHQNKEKGTRKHTCIHGHVCLWASWSCWEAICARQCESASITSELSTPFQSPSILEKLPISEFECAGMSSDVIKGSTGKALTVLSTTDSPYPGWQAYELCLATFILDILTLLVYTHPLSCHSARILWIPLAHNSRFRLLNNKKKKDKTRAAAISE